MDIEPATKRMLAVELEKLAGADTKTTLRRWHRSINMMSGALVILSGKPEELTPAHLVEWNSRLATILKDMERLGKKIAPKKRKQR